MEKKKKKKMGRKILYQSFCLQMFCIFFPWEIFLSELKALKSEARDNKGDREPLGVALSICILLWDEAEITVANGARWISLAA